MIIKKVLVVAVALVMTVWLVACGGAGNKQYDASTLVSVNIIGIDGFARAEILTDHMMIRAILADIREELGNEEALRVERLFDGLSFAITSDTVDLSNGDRLQIELDYDNQAARDLSIRFTNSSFTYTVTGLPEGTVFDPFEGFELALAGVSGQARLGVGFAPWNISEIAHQYGHFNTNCSTTNLSNGDVIAVSYNLNMWLADADYMAVSRTEAEFVVEGLPEFAQTLRDFDTTPIRELARATMISAMESRSAEWGAWRSITESRRAQNRTWAWDVTPSLVRAEFFTRDDGLGAGVRAVYRFEIEGTVTYVSRWAIAAGYSEGDVASSVEYVSIIISPILVQDGAFILGQEAIALTHTSGLSTPNRGVTVGQFVRDFETAARAGQLNPYNHSFVEINLE